AVGANKPAQQATPVLANKDIIDMVSEGLDTSVLLAKMRRSAVSFDVSTEQLIHLKKAGVPREILTAMIERPTGPAMLEPGVDPVRGGVTTAVAEDLKTIRTVVVRAPDEVLRASAEETRLNSRGPA